MAKVREFGVGFESPHAREFVALGKRAEELGFSTFWVPEDPFWRGAFALASAIACGTSKIKIGLGIVNPYTRHPALTAMEFAALDEVSDGRAILGIGAGLKDWIEGRLKIPYTRPTAAMRETVEIIRRIFRGEDVTYAGRVFSPERIKLSFKPVRAEIPIYLGILGPKNCELTGEIADGLLLSVMSSPAYVKFAMDHVRRGLAKSGRDAQRLQRRRVHPVVDLGRRARRARSPAPTGRVHGLPDGAAAGDANLRRRGIAGRHDSRLRRKFRPRQSPGRHGDRRDDRYVHDRRQPRRDAARTCRV